MLAGSGAHSRGRGGGHSELQHSLELVGGTNPEAPHFSALTLCEVSANVKGHQALERRAALQPSEEILYLVPSRNFPIVSRSLQKSWLWRGVSWPRGPAVPGQASAGAGMAAAEAEATGSEARRGGAAQIGRAHV